MLPAPLPVNRRRHCRYPLGLPATLHWVDSPVSTVVEIVDISSHGLRLMSLDGGISVAQRASLHFVLSDQGVCTAAGSVNRVGSSGSFVLTLDESNVAFRDFVASLSQDRS